MFRNNNSFIKINQLKCLTTKVNNTPLNHATGVEKPPKNQDATSVRYNVCKEHVLPKKKFAFDNEVMKTNPASENEETEQGKKQQQAMKNGLPKFSTGKKGQSPFTPSSTRLSVVLPLNMSKLTNPFPEPVKFFPSATVSDQEKANQMQKKFSVPQSTKQAPKQN